VKNIGRQVTVLTIDGNKHEGTLISADENGMEVLVVTKIKKVPTETKHHFLYNDIKETKEIIKF
jgi:small nuclear ribonucleoprotein (snRNP)-like protein